MAGNGFEISFYNDETGQWEATPAPSAKPLAVRKQNPKAAQKRRFEAKRAERLRANEAATANIDKLGSGIASIPKRVVNYIKSSTPSSVGRDVKGIAKATYDAATEDPNAFIEDAIFSPLAAIRDFGDVRETARKLRAQGRNAEAEKMEAMAGTAVLSAVPILGRPAGVATRKAIKAAEKSAVKGATKKAATPKAPAAPVNPVTLIDREYGTDTARRVAEYVSSDAPIAEWRAMAERFTDGGKPNYAQPRPSAYTVKPAQVATDPRIETRKREQQKIRDLELEIQPRALEEPPVESIYDLEGRGLLTTMSDLSAAGDDVLAVNNVRLQRPFSRQGGQGFMFENPGEVWAADKINAKAIQDAAAELEQQTGKPAILAPFTMGPLSSMFSHHPRGLQYAYADAALDPLEKTMLAGDIRKILPEWTDFSDPDAYMTFMRAGGKRRGQLNKLMDKFRERGGLGQGEAVYGTTDLDQLGAPMLALRNLGEVDTRFGLSESKNPAYSSGVPGQGLAKLKEENLGALSLFPALMEQYGYQTPFDFPVGVNKGVASPLRSFQLKPQPTIITDKVLRYLDDLRVQGRDKKP
jgi:hypothetical protein